MGRILDLCGEIAAAAEEGEGGLVLPPDAWDRLRAEWDDADIEDALSLVHDSLLQAELVESADSLSARLVEMLGEFGEEASFKRAQEGGASLTVGTLSQLARRVDRLEEILGAFRDDDPPDRRGLDALQRRLMDVGIEEEMEAGREVDEASSPGGGRGHGPDDDEEAER
jgi:hypothetical protein